jgi:hypothetical protein
LVCPPPQRVDPARSPARTAPPIGDQPNINAALLGTDQRPNNVGADCEAIGANEDLALDRLQYAPDYYGAFVIDPDGHHLGVVCRTSAGR